jgi:hypothetical protein
VHVERESQPASSWPRSRPPADLTVTASSAPRLALKRLLLHSRNCERAGGPGPSFRFGRRAEAPRWCSEVMGETTRAGTGSGTTRSSRSRAAPGPYDGALAEQGPPPSRIWSTRNKTLKKVAPSDASDASAKAHKVEDLDAIGPINGGRIRLRALWGVFPVVVRVHSSAFEVLPLRSCPTAHRSRDGMRRGAADARLSSGAIASRMPRAVLLCAREAGVS